MLGMRVHACFLDEQCKQVGAPMRVYVTTRLGTLTIGERTQGWIPFYGYAKWWHGLGWWPVVYDPPRR